MPSIERPPGPARATARKTTRYMSASSGLPHTASRSGGTSSRPIRMKSWSRAWCRTKAATSIVTVQKAAATRVNSPTATRVPPNVSARAAAQAKASGAGKPICARPSAKRASPPTSRASLPQPWKMARPRPARRRRSNAKSAARRFMDLGAQPLGHAGDDVLGEGADLGLVGPFRHHAQQRLGARVSHHQPPPAVEGGARPVQRLAHFRDRLDVLLLAHAHVPQHLRVHGQLAPQLRQRAARVPDDLQDLERGEEAVARGLVVEKDDVAALLTAQVRPA